MQAIRYKAQVSADRILHVPTPDLPRRDDDRGDRVGTAAPEQPRSE